MERKDILAGISNGDINGIGYEIIIKTLIEPRINEICIPIVFGSPKVAAYHRKALDINNFNFNNIRSPQEAHPKKANMINCLDDEVRVELGKSTPHSGEAAFKSLEAAAKCLFAGEIDVLVTAPIDKHTIQSESFSFPGHTEYLQSIFNVDEVLMLMVSENMKIGTVTGHIPLAEVPKQITEKAILSKLQVFNKSLKYDFGIRKPRIAVLSLNPHAGDNGLLGSEEAEIISPAIASAMKNNMLVFGPFPADGFFGSSEFKKYDGILAMYHDQGLIPFKALAFDGGVNFTAGLPVVRTSPAHGTAYDIAGAGEASESSFRHALYLACDIFRTRQLHDSMSANQLQPQHVDTKHDRPDELPPEIPSNDNQP